MLMDEKKSLAKPRQVYYPPKPAFPSDIAGFHLMSKDGSSLPSFSRREARGGFFRQALIKPPSWPALA
jgi:hypothetical protein